MAFLSDVKKKIESTRNTRKITRAMQLVAANKMKLFQRKSESTRHYAWRLLDGLSLLRVGVGALEWAIERTTGKVLFIVVTSDKGLCGSLNTKLLKTLFTAEEWINTPADDRLLITVGRKSADAARRQQCNVVKSFSGLPEDLSTLGCLQVIAEVMRLWESGAIKKVILVSPHYVNPFVIHHTVKLMLPLTEEMLASHLKWREQALDAAEHGDHYSYSESSVEEVVAATSYQLVEAIFLQAFYELKASEYSSRMVAMKKATESAEDMIAGLTRQYNKLRQASITQQLAELVGGSEAMAEV